MIDLRSFSYPAFSPSLLAADHSRLVEETRKAERLGCHFIHIDVMDGRFVPNVSFGLDFVKEIHDKHHMVNDVHVMIEKPWASAASYVKAGADILTFHFEACPDGPCLRKTIAAIKGAGGTVGVSIKPLTPVEAIFPYLKEAGLVLLMSVEPGKGGQPFIPASLTRLLALRKEIDRLPFSKRPILEVDGGINALTGPACLKAGADLLVAGSYLYGHSDMKERMDAVLKGAR
ncbi:MAG: ribulose-phosphate 3-epimerase [Bacilli bacterium]|jgi:ribulose-phosphate 3-epimerase|nr:ribulose-phosphate 3-epimerase [Bacilli bacterium]